MSINIHPHGEHVCYCPVCSYEKTVEANEKCNQQVCPICGTRMRAKDIGERRVSLPLSAQYGAGRRRVYWEREGGLIPSEGIGQRSINRISQEGETKTPAIVSALITGIGVAAGFAIVKKLSTRRI
jgi:hypothetical protein